MEKPEKDKNKSKSEDKKPAAKILTRDNLNKLKQSEKVSEDNETKDDSEGNENLPNPHDSDNELDYSQEGKQIDNSAPLKNELGRKKFQKIPPLPMYKKLFSSDI